MSTVQDAIVYSIIEDEGNYLRIYERAFAEVKRAFALWSEFAFQNHKCPRIDTETIVAQMLNPPDCVELLSKPLLEIYIAGLATYCKYRSAIVNSMDCDDAAYKNKLIEAWVEAGIICDNQQLLVDMPNAATPVESQD